MIKISKKPEPQSLIDFRRTIGKKLMDCEESETNYFEQIPSETKNDIRKQLLTEQGYLCAYCMTRIDYTPGKTKIEHWHSQSEHYLEQLDYWNMLLTCKGYELDNNLPTNNLSQSDLHCDSRKGSQDILFNPANPAHDIENKITYQIDGTIISPDPEFNKQLKSILNLNYARLKSNRQNVVAAVGKLLNSRQGSRTVSEIKRILKYWQNRDKDGCFKEYCGIAIFFLKKRLARNN